MASSTLLEILKHNSTVIGTRVNRYEKSLNNKLTGQWKHIFGNNRVSGRIKTDTGTWSVALSVARVKQKPGALDLTIRFKLLSGNADAASLSVDFYFAGWSRDNFVLLPASAYNGNRFESRRISYSPKLLDPRDIGVDKPIIISDVPRLNINDGPSFIQERSGSMSFPAAGFYSVPSASGCFILTAQESRLGDYGYTITENKNRDKAMISITAPVVRELYKYRITDNQWPSDDTPHNFRTGETLTMNIRICFFPCRNIQSLFDYMIGIRNDMVGRESMPPLFSFSSTFPVQEEKFNRQNWVEKHGYYSVGMREMFLQDWQIGWTGGMISTYPLLAEGGEKTRQQVLRNFDFLFPAGIAPSGFFWDSGMSDDEKMNWYGGDIRKPHTKNWHLIRKSGDAVYYIIKQLMLMKKLSITIKPAWEQGVKQAADALVKLWNRYHQFGNFVDSITGDIIVGGSTSGAIIPAALIMAYRYFAHPAYLLVAEESAEYYYDHFITKGITCGGPGDAMQNPDSESSYSMLESFMLLYVQTKNNKYLDMAKDMAAQFTSWVMSYNYRFKDDCTLKRLNIKTTGSVCANTQNKHGAPGICTFSGIALLRLYRATGNRFYIELLRDIAQHIPQMISHPLRPIDKMPIGWLTERVSTTDWFEGLGEIMYGSTWAETALMLTTAEIPSIYIDLTEDRLFLLDHLQATIEKKSPHNSILTVKNPTKCDCRFKLFIDRDRTNPLLFNEIELINTPRYTVEAGKKITIDISSE